MDTLILLRHGKSAYPDKVKDHDRPLAQRGIRQAGLAGKAIRRYGHVVDLVLCSTAERARATLEQAAVDAPVRFVPKLYGATGEQILKIVDAERGDAATVLVVGHDPGLAEAAQILDPTFTFAKFPTSAFAVVEDGHAELHIPR
ncbi:SixA phosphatase family protein [Tsukamurella pseudospumae]|uniref:Phosphoglycerate kinase n=1 Tax=Tsukamurella pseudospumae TaxID=239498 RepID=A0A137ZZE5_9ACTN|nr:histidine phosphatase family protein [Tsukamurella pseudospumae]KXO89304.1 phosphoglycerate kinase [Tsukamurella pseudospumae]KXP03571.1 phosphoglycerate kinase [Tsukamurella pseudospumae]